MIYEARHAVGINYVLAGACALLSILGFAVAGIIPTESGEYPAVGAGIIAACFAAAAIFILRARNRKVQARVDEVGVHPAKGQPLRWNDIERFYVIRAGIQRIARFNGKDGAAVGINTTFYDRGISDLSATVRHHRPDLVP